MMKVRHRLPREALAEPGLDGACWHAWLTAAVSLVFVSYLSADIGLLWPMIDGDVTRLSAGICVLFAAASVWAGRLAWRLSMHHRTWLLEPETPGSWSREYLDARRRLGRVATPDAIDTLLDERLHDGMAPLAFVNSLLLKLGLLGTVVGFVMMLASIGSSDAIQAGALGALIERMGTGMRVSLYTTVAGLIGSMALGLQLLIVERAAERLHAKLAHWASERLAHEANP